MDSASDYINGAYVCIKETADCEYGNEDRREVQ